MNDTLTKVVPILSTALKIPQDQIHAHSRLAEDLHVDSLDASVALMDVEEQFGIDIPHGERNYSTVADVVLHIEELCHKKTQNRSDKTGDRIPTNP